MDKGKGVAHTPSDADGLAEVTRLRSRISRKDKGKSVGKNSNDADEFVEDTRVENPKFSFTVTVDHLSGKIPVAISIEFARALLKRNDEDKDPKFTITLTNNHLIGKILLLISAYFVRDNIFPLGHTISVQLYVEDEKSITCPLVRGSTGDNNRPLTEVYLGHAWKKFSNHQDLFEGLEVEFTMRVVDSQIHF